MTVTLTPDQEKFIAERMNRDGHSSPEKVVEEGLKLIQAKEEHQKRLTDLRRELQMGIDQINRGEVFDGPATIQNIRAKLLNHGQTAA